MTDHPAATRCAECTCERGGVYCNWIASSPQEYLAEITRLRALLSEATAAMRIVHQDCIGRMPMSRDGQTVPIGASAWARLCAALAQIAGEG